MRVGAGISTKLSPESAAEAAASDALATLGHAGAEAAIVCATGAWGSGIADVVDAVAAVLSGSVTAGSSVDGVMARGIGVEQNPAVAVLGWSGLGAQPFFLDGLAGEEQRFGEELLAIVHEPLGEHDLLVLFMDSEGLLPLPLVGGLAEPLGAGRLVGIGASALPGAAPLVWGAGEGPARRAISGLCVRGREAPRQTVVRGCRPIGGFLGVTRSRGHWLMGIDGRPALDVLREIVAELDLGEPQAAIRHLSVLISYEGDVEGSALECGRLHEGLEIEVRNIVGLDLERGGIALPQPVSSGFAKLAFALHDGVTARVNLEDAVSRNATPDPALGLFMAGGSDAGSLFGGVAPEARCLEAHLPGVPLLGLHGAFQLASPSARRHGGALLTHCGVLTLLDA